MTTTSSDTNPSPCLFLRLEGPLQSWGGRTIGRFRRTESIPTKSGIMGLLGAALGLTRRQLNARLEELNGLEMTIRVDRAGELLEDYQTVGAKIGVLSAQGKLKKTAGTDDYEAIISPREYLVNASFLVILTGSAPTLQELADALQNPVWPLFLGRKRCVPGTAVFAGLLSSLPLKDALQRDGIQEDDHSLLPPDETQTVRVVTELIDVDTFAQLSIDDGTSINLRFERARAYVTDRAMHLEPPVYGGRIVLDFEMKSPIRTLPRPDLTHELFDQTDRKNPPQRGSDPAAKKLAREKSAGRCIFCRFQPVDPRHLHAHHRTYVRRGRELVRVDRSDTTSDDLVMLCEECHAAVTMLEYQSGFGLHRIDPCNPDWRSRIWQARQDRRRFGKPDSPELTPISASVATAQGRESGLFESVIPLRAGNSFPDDAPGNRWLTNRHYVHQRLSMAFPEVSGSTVANGYGVSRDEGGFLFRIEDDVKVARLIVRSQILPDWGRAFGDAGWLFDGAIPSPQLFDLEHIDTGSQWSFRLYANPTVKRKVSGKKNGRREACVTKEQQLAWLLRKAEEGGFAISTIKFDNGKELPNVKFTPEGQLKSFRRKDCRTLNHFGLRMDGVLQITDENRFIESLKSGIGPAKAFGFGLLSIARV